MAYCVSPVNAQKQMMVVYINGMNTTVEQAKQEVKQISQSLARVQHQFFYRYVYNPTNSNDYLSNNNKEKKSFSIEMGIDCLLQGVIKCSHVFIVTHSNGAKQARQLLNKLGPIFDEDDIVRKKISVLNFGPDTILSNTTAKVAQVLNFIFKKDRIAFLGQALNNSNNHLQKSEIIWLDDPKKIPKKKLPESADGITKLLRNLEYVLDNAKNRHQFTSYLPYMTRAIAELTLFKK